MRMKAAKITRAGQISLPAEVRRRWHASRVVVEDRGDHLVVRPIPNDPVEALQGLWSDSLVSSDELRAIARRDEKAAVSRRE